MTPPDDNPITILVNNKPLKIPKNPMTGKEIKELAEAPLNYLLVLVVKDPDPVAGGDENNFSALYNKGRALNELHKYQEAKQTFEVILENHDIVTNLVIFHYGKSLMGAEEYETAIQLI